MFRRLTLTVGFGAMVLGCIANAQSVVTVMNLDPFTHVALIPAESDLSSIKFEGVKLVKVPTKARSITVSYCKEQVFRDPGGSMYCPDTRLEAETPAYEVTYSYTAQPMAADEHHWTSFAFRVYYRPEELPPSVREAISRGMGRDSDVAGFFDVNTSKLPKPRSTVVVLENSRFCERNLVDGAWVQADSQCKEEVRYKTVTVAGDYLTVRVDPALPKVSQR